ncbi:MAG: YegP family protein [Clostridia bacterium]|nr:YegP family protein [Clostridia bacterium]
MGKFVIKKTKNSGFKFDLKAGNGETIATSEIYKTLASCKNGIESVRKNSAKAGVEDLTVEGFEPVKHPKFQIYTDKAGEFRFRLKATNGEIIAVSEGYKALTSCKNGIESVKKNAPEAEVKIEEA